MSLGGIRELNPIDGGVLYMEFSYPGLKVRAWLGLALLYDLSET